jgi:hypothetical protein
MNSICPKNKVWDRILKKCRVPLKRGRKKDEKQNFLGGEVEIGPSYEYLAKAYTLIDDNVSDNSDEEIRRRKKKNNLKQYNKNKQYF